MRTALFMIALLTFPAHAGELLGDDIYQSMKAAKSSSIRAGRHQDAREAYCKKNPKTCAREDAEAEAAIEERRDRNRNAHREERRRAQARYEARQRRLQRDNEHAPSRTVISR